MRLVRFAAIIVAVALFAGGFAAARAGAQEAPASPPAGVGSPPPLPAPQPGPDNPVRHKLAVAQFLAWQQGDVDRTLYADDVNAQLSDEALDQGSRSLANMGALQSATFVGTSHARGIDVYVYKMTCEHGSVNMDFALAPDGKIALIFFV